MYLCPKHNKEMRHSNATITIGGTTYQTEVAICTSCKNRYIGIQLMPNATCFTFEGVRYEYLPCLKTTKIQKAEASMPPTTPKQNEKKKEKSAPPEKPIKRTKKCMFALTPTKLNNIAQVRRVTPTVINNLKFNNATNVLYICKSTTACLNKNHELESVTGVVENERGFPIKMNINYCKQCRKYFLEYSEYQYYRKRYGILFGNFSMSSDMRTDSIFSEMAEASKLYLAGYTVNQTDDLSDQRRRNILVFLIDRKIIEKSEIISHLDFLIKTNRHRRDRAIAIERWTSDVNWCREYRLDTQRQVEIGEVKKNK